MTWWLWALTGLVMLAIGYYIRVSWRDRLRPGDSLPGGE